MKGRVPAEEDYSRLIREPFALYDPDIDPIRPRIVYCQPEDLDLLPLFDAVHSVKKSFKARTGGMQGLTRVFGFMPRVKVRNDFCTATTLAAENPAEHGVICSYANALEQEYAKLNPELHAKHVELRNTHLRPEWSLDGSVFTSGIINDNNTLPYHFDSGNYPEVWSAMVVFKHKVAGGYLSIPEYDIGVELVNGSVLFFDGQRILHGVTPIHLLAEDSHRYSIVYYSLRQMWQCLTPKDELSRARLEKTTLETADRKERLRGKPKPTNV